MPSYPIHLDIWLAQTACSLMFRPKTSKKMSVNNKLPDEYSIFCIQVNYKEKELAFYVPASPLINC